MHVEIFQFFIKRMSSVHAKRAAPEKVAGNTAEVMLYTEEKCVMPLYTTYLQTISF